MLFCVTATLFIVFVIGAIGGNFGAIGDCTAKGGKIRSVAVIASIPDVIGMIWSGFDDTLSIVVILQAIPAIILCIMVFLILIEYTRVASCRVHGLLLFLHERRIISFILLQLMVILVGFDCVGCELGIIDAKLCQICNDWLPDSIYY